MTVFSKNVDFKGWSLLNLDVAHAVTQVHTAGYCIKVAACQQGSSTINMAASVFLTQGSWGIDALKFLSHQRNSCLKILCLPGLCFLM